MRGKALAIAALLTLPVGSGHAGLIGWTDWTTATIGTNATASGTITVGSETVFVTYTGDITFFQLGSSADLNYWTEDGIPMPYTESALIDNPPTAGEMIALERSGITNTLSFSKPVSDPILAIVSLGRPRTSVTYDFDAPFTVLSNGVGAYSHSLEPGILVLSEGDLLTGNEVNAAIQFPGLISSISWMADVPEYWHGITVGLSIPEPTTLTLLALGLAGLGAIRRKKLPS
jgi:hypothetical protein